MILVILPALGELTGDGVDEEDLADVERESHPATDLEGSFRYPLAREGVYTPGGPAFLAHAKQKVSYIIGLTALQLAFFRGY